LVFPDSLFSWNTHFFASDTSYFRHPTSGPARPIENWVLRFSALKRLYRLMTQYVSDVLQKPTSSLDVPDLQAIAKDFDLGATLVMCRLLIVIGVQCERNKEFIDKIRCLGEGDQHLIMKAIEQVSLEILVCRRT
jgi:protein HOOK3